MTNQPLDQAILTKTTDVQFFTDPDFDFVTRCMMGYAAQGVMDIGRVFATVSHIRDGDADSWHAAWLETANDYHARAQSSLALKHTNTARRMFLAASESYAQAIAFSDRQTEQTGFAETFGLHSNSWDAFVDASGGCTQRVAVPYENTHLPGYLFRPDASGARRPTLVMTNGSEGSKSGLWAWGVVSTLARGWNAFIYDGPGQQTMLFDFGHPFRHDWEAVLTPVVDSLITRPDVDSSALFAYGCSQAGYWVTRALAFEHRFVAAVVDPGVVDVSTSWLGHLPFNLLAVLKAGDKQGFNASFAAMAKDPHLAQKTAARGRPYAQPTPYDTFAAVLRYNVQDTISEVTTPLLITDPDEETFWPGQSRQMYQLLTHERQIARFSRDTGDNWHCEPMGRVGVELAMLDFLQDQLAKTRLGSQS